MVPFKLKLRNFMAYQEAELDFQGIHLAALTGENGAGKSSLLDAITWVIWGKGRAKRDDELIRLGQSEMEVEYTFDLNDAIYRIIRKREAGGRGRSSLNFHVQDAGGWRTLTEASLRATERKINDIMRLDYETFINSAFLLQGRADEFTTKPPAQRKKILSDILGLDIYEVYAERAKKRANEKERDATMLEAEIGQIEKDLAREAEYRANLTQAEQEVARLTAALQAAETEMQALRDQHRAINDKQRQLNDLQDRLKRAEIDVAEFEKDINEAQANLDSYRALLNRRAEIEAGLERLKQARMAVQDWEQRLHDSTQLSTRRHELEKAFSEAQAKIEADLREVETRINMLRPKLAAVDVQRSQLAQAQAELDQFHALDATQEQQRAEQLALQEESARLSEQNRQLKLEMDEIKENMDRLQEAGFICPICRRPLDDQHRAEVSLQFQTDGKAKGDTFRANKARLDEIASRQHLLKQSLTEADLALRHRPQLQRRLAQLEHTIQEADQATIDLEAAQAARIQLESRLANRDFAQDVLFNLLSVEAELAELGYNKGAHDQAKAEVAQLVAVEPDGLALAEAAQRIQEQEKRQERDRARRQRLLEQTEADRRRVAELEVETKDLPQLNLKLNQASLKLDETQRECRFAQDQVARVQQQLDHVAYQAKERTKKEAKLQQVRETISIFRELQVAFGKKGVQALLIEGAIPEIEEEANALLTRMTDGRMNIRFETQREAKNSDSPIETLDILIADEAGTRDYEMYSGGEAFRINFAIRVAISKILARRAGARLQTLVMDEGFGTQDVQGRERLVEAINAIQNDFEKIIVVTHVEELKEAFPVRIDVWKTAQGSQVAIR
jgi:exonuclease SbcC